MTSEYEYKADVAAGKQFRAELEGYMAKNIWKKVGDTCCKYHEFCRNSCDAVERNFGYGQLPHVGENYALKRGNKDFRVAVSAAEVGAGYSYQSICRRTDEITKCGNAKLNPHMRGTLYVLQLLFQGKYELSDRKMKIGKQDANIFSAFALPNFLLCSAPDRNDGIENGSYTETMRANCARHFHETLRILKPNILITLGSRPHEYFRAYHGVNVDCQSPKFHEITVSDLDNPAAKGHDVLMLSLYHPAYYRAWSHENIDGKIKKSINDLLAKYDEAV